VNDIYLVNAAVELGELIAENTSVALHLMKGD
jgi:hypothetical protein